MLSFWEKESFINYDIIIVGSGIVGLSTAISIKNKYPDKSVLVLERGIYLRELAQEMQGSNT